MHNITKNDSIRSAVRTHYTAIAERTESGNDGCGCTQAGCCGGSTPSRSYGERLGYSANDLSAAPDGANLNLGCGNPFAIASISAGETVLDLGSGAGFDVFLAAHQLNGTGRAIGVDMTPAMITQARRHAAEGGHNNVEFRLGEIENLPVADASVDLIISNCVINLSPDKPRVFREAIRVLKSGGRIALADVVATGPLPEHVRNDPAQYAGCVSGAALVNDLRAMLIAAGFRDVSITKKTESRELINDWTENSEAANLVVSALIQAAKP